MSTPRRPFNPQPKPAARHVVAGKEWHSMIGAKDGWACRICGARTCWSGFSAHHIVKRSQGGDDVAANGCYLCGSGTTGCHGLVERGDHTTRTRLRAGLHADEVAYAQAKKSLAWLDAQYPSK